MTGNRNIRYQAVLRPHRSISVRAINIVVGVVATVWLLVGLAFTAFGAWPVFGFLGAEVILLYAALVFNNRSGRAVETIELTSTDLTVRRVNHWGRRQSWSFQPHWLQVLVEGRRHQTRLKLRSHGRSLVIGAFLNNDERAELARALKEQLIRLSCRPAPAGE